MLKKKKKEKKEEEVVQGETAAYNVEKQKKWTPNNIIHDMHIKMLNMADKAAPPLSPLSSPFGTKLLQKSIILWSHSAALSV